MAGKYPTQDEIVGRFYNEDESTRVSFQKLLEKYGLRGHDQVVEDISLRALKGKNDGEAFVTNAYQKNYLPGEHPSDVGRVYKEKGKPWTHYGDEHITRLLPGSDGEIVAVN
jgi:hypothetical protein